jgi:hypothetical protein
MLPTRPDCYSDVIDVLGDDNGERCDFVEARSSAIEVKSYRVPTEFAAELLCEFDETSSRTRKLFVRNGMPVGSAIGNVGQVPAPSETSIPPALDSNEIHRRMVLAVETDGCESLQ